MRDQIESSIRRVSRPGTLGAMARQQGKEAVATEHSCEAYELALHAANHAPDASWHAAQLDALLAATRLALDCGEASRARRLMEEALLTDASAKFADGWVQVCDISAWPDEWLIGSVRSDPPDTQSLDELANRYWKPLFARCQLLTLNQQTAGDLAQEAWCRLLRNRHGLKPSGNFLAYLTTIATNLWRDSHRAARRAGPMADHRFESLDATNLNEGAETLTLAEKISDLGSLSPSDQSLLAIDIDNALERLTPQQREVLVARFIVGESCAEIAHRYGRTEQSVSGWVRQALREMKWNLAADSKGIRSNE